MSAPHDRCFLHVEGINKCCCNCKHHLPVHHHCCTLPRPAGDDGSCVCKVQKGWACVIPELGRVYDNWRNHDAGCECYEEKEGK